MIDRRLDVTFVRRLAEALNDGTIVLVGPEQDPDPELRELRRVVRLPAQSFDRLPALARQAAVLIMPYADLPVTRAMQPLKLKEYLATGCPVVVADLPATRPWSEALDVATTSDEFSRAVLLRLQTGLPPTQRQAHAPWSRRAGRRNRTSLKTGFLARNGSPGVARGWYVSAPPGHELRQRGSDNPAQGIALG